MRQEVVNYINGLDKKSFTNNTQKALYTLLSSLEDNDGWVPLSKFRVNSAGSRIRDLRKNDYGGFNVVCRSASKLDRRGNKNTFYYKLIQKNVTVTKLKNIFEK